MADFMYKTHQHSVKSLKISMNGMNQHNMETYRHLTALEISELIAALRGEI